MIPDQSRYYAICTHKKCVKELYGPHTKRLAQMLGTILSHHTSPRIHAALYYHISQYYASGCNLELYTHILQVLN